MNHDNFLEILMVVNLEGGFSFFVNFQVFLFAWGSFWAARLMMQYGDSSYLSRNVYLSFWTFLPEFSSLFRSLKILKQDLIKSCIYGFHHDYVIQHFIWLKMLHSIPFAHLPFTDLNYNE